MIALFSYLLFMEDSIYAQTEELQFKNVETYITDRLDRKISAGFFCCLLAFQS